MSEGRQLEISRAEVTDTARYSCIATNEAGVADKDFDLDVLGKHFMTHLTFQSIV